MSSFVINIHDMKRLLLLLLLLPLSLMPAPPVQAAILPPSLTLIQHNRLHDFKYNTYLSIGVGPNIYLRSLGTGIGAGVDIAAGKWMLTTAGLRLQASAYYSQWGTGSPLYAYGSLDFLFDPITAIRGRNSSNVFRSYVILGSGLVHNGSGDNDFFAAFGLGADLKVADDWRLFAELRCRVHPSDFDDNAHSSLMNSLMMGVVRDIAYNPTRSRAIYETQRMENDWFFQIALGVNSFNYKGIGSLRDRLSLLTPDFEFGIGKRLTTLWSVRAHFSGLYTQSGEELFSFYNARGDVLLDLASLLGRDLPVPRFSAQPYVGAGVVTRLDDQSHFLIAVAGGGQLLYRPMPCNTIYLDARYVVTPPRFAHVAADQSTFSVGVFTMTLGYSYTFTRSSFR